MDNNDFERIQLALGDFHEVSPQPDSAEDNYQYLDIKFDNVRRPADVLNKLGRAGLIGKDATKPTLKLIGESAYFYARDGSGAQSAIYTLTFEDLVHPNSGNISDS